MQYCTFPTAPSLEHERRRRGNSKELSKLPEATHNPLTTSSELWSRGRIAELLALTTWVSGCGGSDSSS
ncbi:hypothetical protein C0J52_25232 [Blattella germanica]|nr:hypothetical protein C0J52_25232 [Blattella germanica]